MEDSRIIALLWQRSENAIAALQSSFGELLHQICSRILPNVQDAEECVNDTYLAIWNAIPPEKPDPLRPYVCKTGRNIALNRLRRDSAQKRMSRYDLSLEELAEVLPDHTQEERLSVRLLGQAIDRFLAQQRAQNRILFLRRYWFGDSLQEAARFAGLRANAAAVRLYRLRITLKEYLIREELYEEG